MYRISLVLIGTCALLGFVRGQFHPISMNDPVAIVKSLKDRIEFAQQHIEKLSDISNIDFFAKHGKESLQALAENQVNASECAESVYQFLFLDIPKKERYAIKMVDSWGKIESGILTGNLKWMGRYYECINSHAKNFSGRWCGLTIGGASMSPLGLGAAAGVQFGSCLPDTCSQAQVEDIISPLTDVTGIPTSTYCTEPYTEYRGIDIVGLLVTIILGTFLIIGTSYDIYLMMRPTSGYDTLIFDTQEVSNIENSNPSVLAELVLSFSLIKNTKTLLDTSQKEGNINVLHGIRFISMTWVMLGHTFIFGISYMNNSLDYANYYITTGSFQAVGNAFFSVDSFFFLSGLLVTYLGMREMKKSNGKLTVLMPYLYRYLRLTPPYAFGILISISLYSKMGDGPIWPAVFQGFEKSCLKYWWTNLLYISDVYPLNAQEQCYGWGWYLSNDMQFFLLSPFILWLFYRSWIGGMVVLAIGTLANIAIVGGLSSHYKEQPQSLQMGLLAHLIIGALNPDKASGNLTSEVFSDVTTIGATTTGFATANVTTAISPTAPPPLSKVDTVFSDIYFRPWCRFGVYLIGMATGYVLHRTNLKMRLNKIFVLVMWIVVTILALTDVYGLWGAIKENRNLSVNVAAFYNAISRPLWGACMAWLVIACSCGYGGPIDRFLSWKAFIPLSRLTYCAYLVHPLVIFWYFGIMETTFQFSMPNMTMYFIGFVVLTNGVAYVLSMLVEMPTIGIIKTLFRGKRSNSKKDLKEDSHLVNDNSTAA